MTWYPACAATPEDDGPNFDPPVMGSGLSVQVRRLREAEAFTTVSREAREFHERRARRYGVNTPRGLAHFKAAKAYTREGGRLQEMFENGGEIGELPPKAIMAVNKAAIAFHKGQAEKAGLDSDQGHAHIAAMEHHMDIHNKAKKQHQASKQQRQPMQAAAPGHSGKQSPVPVPAKSEQPNEDIHQDLPPVPLKRLQQGNETYGAHAGRIRMSSKKREAVGAKPDHLEDCFPKPVKKLMKPNLVFRAHKLKMHSGKRGQEAGGQGMVAQRYDQSHPEGFVAPQYADLQHGTESRRKIRKGWPARQKTMHRKMGDRIARHSLESRRDSGNEDAPSSIDLKSFYTPPSREDGWRGGITFSPRVQKQNSVVDGVTIKEF